MNSPVPQVLLPPNPALEDGRLIGEWAANVSSLFGNFPKLPPLMDHLRLQSWIRDLQWTLAEFIQKATVQLNSQVQGVGDSLVSASTLKPTHPIHKVTGTTTVSTISVSSAFTGPLFLIPKGVWAWNTSGNIQLSGTATVDKLLIFVFDGLKWYPSYV